MNTSTRPPVGSLNDLEQLDQIRAWFARHFGERFQHVDADGIVAARDADHEEALRGEIPSSITWALDTLSRMNGDRTAVVHLDRSMLHGTDYLPTANLRGDDGFYPFPTGLRDEIAAYFGPDIDTAQARVQRVNASRGVSREDAQEIVLGIMRAAGL